MAGREGRNDNFDLPTDDPDKPFLAQIAALESGETLYQRKPSRPSATQMVKKYLDDNLQSGEIDKGRQAAEIGGGEIQ